MAFSSAGSGAVLYEELFINMPTLHVPRYRDRLVYGSLTLYNVCCRDEVRLIYHGIGHSVCSR